MRVFVGIRLPKDLEATCEAYRRSFKAPKTIAHLTVVPPFVWEDSPENLLRLLASGLKESAPFQVTGSGIGSFGQRVLFINVNLTPELEGMQRALSLCLKSKGVAIDTRPYHPHITLATRLSSQEFNRYRRELDGFHPEVAFTCSHLSIFEFTEERRWQESWSLPLEGSRTFS